MPPERLTILIDGSYALSRVLKVGGEDNPFAFMMSSDGIKTGGVFGYLVQLAKSLEMFDIVSVINVWDSFGYSQRRTRLYPEYKANRTEAKSTEEGKQYFANFTAQRAMIMEFLEVLGIPSVHVPGKEADDIIGYLSKMIDGPVMVLSDDKDYYQLINENVCVYRPVQEQYLDHRNFAGLKGFPTPQRYLMYCAIVGDPGDNVFGVPGIGGKTATNVAIRCRQNTRDSLLNACKFMAASDTRNRSRYTKIAENVEKVKTNLKLLDLTQEDFLADDRACIRKQLVKCHPPMELEVMALLRKYDMQSISKKMSYWLKPFNKLTTPTHNIPEE